MSSEIKINPFDKVPEGITFDRLMAFHVKGSKESGKLETDKIAFDGLRYGALRKNKNGDERLFFVNGEELISVAMPEPNAEQEDDQFTKFSFSAEDTAKINDVASLGYVNGETATDITADDGVTMSTGINQKSTAQNQSAWLLGQLQGDIETGLGKMGEDWGFLDDMRMSVGNDGKKIGLADLKKITEIGKETSIELFKSRPSNKEMLEKIEQMRIDMEAEDL